MSDEFPRDADNFGPGAQVAGYRLEEQIGRGGMAVVYRAHDARLDRRVALKILAPELARDQAFRQRFIRESRAAAAVDHPNIIPIFEAGEASGVLFIAMRYVHGRDLRTLLDREGTLPAVHVTYIIAQMASALDAAHARGLVHRDVKPANMLLDEAAGSDQRDHVYLSDFGLSKQSLAAADLTSAGQFLGTLDYVAPEQIEGRPVDGRADLYALACAAFEMLCGAPPFNRDQRMAVLWAQLSEPPPRLTARRPDLPAAVDQVMAKALAKSPGDRYTSCVEFAVALRTACGLGAGDAGSAGTQPSPGAASATPPRPTRPATEVAMPVGGPGGGTDAGDLGSGTAGPGAGAGAGGAGAGGGRIETQAAAGLGRAAGTGHDEPGSSRRPATQAAGPPEARSADAGRGPNVGRDPGAGVGGAGAAGAAAGPAAAGQGSSRGPATEAAGPREARSGDAGRGADAGLGRDTGRDWDRGRDAGRGADARRDTGRDWDTGRDAGRGADARRDTGRGWQAGRDASRGWQAGRDEDTAAGAGRATGPSFQGTPGPPQRPFPGTDGTPPAGRPWMRSRAALVVACAAVVGLAGAAFAIHAAGNGGAGARQAALTAPGCSTATAAARPLANVHPAMVALPGKPYAVAVTPNGRWTFVTLGQSVAVMKNGGALTPSLVQTVSVPNANGEALTHDGRYLVVASGSGAFVLNVAKLEQGSQDAAMGKLFAPGGHTGAAVQVAVSPDDRFVFVTLMGQNRLAVFNLQDALTKGFNVADFVGFAPLGVKPVGVRVSSDGRWLYVTSEMRSTTTQQGTLTVLDLRKAETKPAASVAATVNAGCGPVRAINSADSSVVWVTARESDEVLAFSASKLISDPKGALLARIRVGEAPIGLTFIDNEKRIVVANSNIHAVEGATANLTVLDTAGALAGRPALLGVVQAGDLPRQFTVHGKTLLVTNSNSQQLEAVNIADLP